jgi:hypothetical protein
MPGHLKILMLSNPDGGLIVKKHSQRIYSCLWKLKQIQSKSSQDQPAVYSGILIYKYVKDIPKIGGVVGICVQEY